MKKKEAKSQIQFNQYLRETGMRGFFELKQTDSETFPFAKIEKNQWEGLEAAEKNGLVWKLSDEDSRPKPCDCLSIPPLPSYLVIRFLDGFYLIRFEVILKLRDEGCISVSRSVAETLAEKIIKI